MVIDLSKFQKHQVWVGISLCSDIEKTLATSYRKILTNEELNRNARYRFERDRHRDLIARALVRTSLAESIGIEPEAIEFELGENGKPLLKDHPFFFNLSHSGDFIVLAIAKHRVGLDVENISRDVNSEAISERFFTVAEIEDIVSCNEFEKKDRFFDYWTLKEAYMKARGEGIRLGLSNFGFTLAKPAISLYVNDEIEENVSNWQFRCMTPYDDCRLSLALNTPEKNIDYHFEEVIPLQSRKPLYLLEG